MGSLDSACEGQSTHLLTPRQGGEGRLKQFPMATLAVHPNLNQANAPAPLTLPCTSPLKHGLPQLGRELSHGTQVTWTWVAS